MPKKCAPNAKDVLPKAVSSKLQRHCSGVMYIPAPQTQAEINMARVRSLQIHGHLVPQIAQIVGLSTKSVRNIIKPLDNRNITGSHSDYKIYETVPPEIVELVQRHASGLIYVPPKMSQADRRRTRVKRMIDKGFCVGEIAKRTGLMERRVWQIKKAESADTQSRLTENKTRCKTNKCSAQDPFDLDHNVEEHIQPRVCPTCGSVLVPNENDGDICLWLQSDIKSKKINNEIEISSVPFAVIDRQF